MANAVTIVNGTTVIGSSLTGSVQWPGGRTALCLEATAYGSGVFLQLRGQAANSGLNVNATTYSANQLTIYDLPPGTYGLVVQSSSCVACYAKLVSVPYDV